MLIIVSCALAVLVGHVGAYRCYKPEPMEQIELEKFTNGTWFELMRYINEFEGSAKCVTLQHTLDLPQEKMMVNYNWTNPNSLEALTVDVKDNTNGSYDMMMNFPGDEGPSPYLLLGTDYEIYAVIYNCYEFVNENETEPYAISERLWYLSRSHRTSAEFWAGCTDAVSGKINTDPLMMLVVDQTCFNEPTTTTTATTTSVTSSSAATQTSEVPTNETTVVPITDSSATVAATRSLTTVLFVYLFVFLLIS